MTSNGALNPVTNDFGGTNSMGTEATHSTPGITTGPTATGVATGTGIISTTDVVNRRGDAASGSSSGGANSDIIRVVGNGVDKVSVEIPESIGAAAAAGE